MKQQLIPILLTVVLLDPSHANTVSFDSDTSGLRDPDLENNWLLLLCLALSQLCHRITMILYKNFWFLFCYPVFCYLSYFNLFWSHWASAQSANRLWAQHNGRSKDSCCSCNTTQRAYVENSMQDGSHERTLGHLFPGDKTIRGWSQASHSLLE